MEYSSSSLLSMVSLSSNTSLILGAMSGVFWTMATPVTAEVVGLQDLASALSLVWTLGTVIPTTCSQPAPFHVLIS